MDRFKGLAKKGWHPEKEGGIRNSVKGMIGRGDSDKSSSSSTPYVKKDPSQFAPPPTTRRYGEGESPAVPARTQSTEASTTASQRQDEPAEEPTYERGPFVINKSGKDISKFAPPPPTRRSGAPTPPPRSSTVSQTSIATSPATTPAPAAAAKPGLPPRLPPRTASAPTTPDEPTPSNGYLNQSAASRLAASGVRVPAFEIGANQRLPTQSNSSNDTSTPASTGTTWAEKQAAIKTANLLHSNPNTVSMAELRAATSTARNFQERHGDQVASGVTSAQQANQKYGIANRVDQLSAASGKGAPPPIPAKKVLNQTQNGPPAPPPLPMSSKPRPT